MMYLPFTTPFVPLAHISVRMCENSPRSGSRPSPFCGMRRPSASTFSGVLLLKRKTCTFTPGSK